MYPSLGSLPSEGRQGQRLPVNPRRHKVALDQRKRVIRACNACNIRRVKCTGEQPCQRCLKSSRECEYPAPETDRNVLKMERERLQRENDALKRMLHSTLPAEAAFLIHQAEQGEFMENSTFGTFQPPYSESDEEEAADGRLLRDGDGIARFHGPTSGATFLDCLKKFMAGLVPLSFEPDSYNGSSFLVSIGRYQTFDSRPLPNPDVDPLWLPGTSSMIDMLDVLRHHIQDGPNNMPSGGIFWWGGMNIPSSPTIKSIPLSTMTTGDTFRHLAFHHVCFALASSIGPASFRLSEQHSGEAYFMRARTLLGNPLDTVRFTLDDVPVLMLMGFYLIELNRRDAAYMYVSLAVRIAVIHGVFRASHVREAEKRTYWTLYILERWLSTLMGRPPSIMDEAIKLPLPEDTPMMPPAAGLSAHIELARISGYIVCETFRVAPRNPKPCHPTEHIERALARLDDWKSQLPEALKLFVNQPELDPASCMLHMEHNQLIVLITRPILLALVKQSVGKRYVGGFLFNEHHVHDGYVHACCEAAHRNLILAQRMRPVRRFLQAGLHFVFNAAVILLLDRILHGSKNPYLEGRTIVFPGNDVLHVPEVDFAIAVFEEESKKGTNYPRDCCKVLRDLKVIIDGYLARHVDSPPQTNGHHRSPDLTGDIIDAMNKSTSANAIGKDDATRKEMVRWVQTGGLQLRNSLLI